MRETHILHRYVIRTAALIVLFGNVQGTHATETETSPRLDILPASWTALDAQELARDRARGNETAYNAEMSGGTVTVNGSFVNNIDGSAFSSTSGIINVIQNNGNEVIIQTGFNVHISLVP